jgi:hypothetical protein
MKTTLILMAWSLACYGAGLYLGAATGTVFGWQP